MGCDLVRHGRWHVPAPKLSGKWQCGHGGSGVRERPWGSWASVFHQDPLLRAAPFQRGTTGITQRGSWSLCPCCHSQGWKGQLSEWGPPNPGWFEKSGQGSTSQALCSKKRAQMGMGWQVGAGPATGVFPCSTLVLKMGAELEAAVEKPTEG